MKTFNLTKNIQIGFGDWDGVCANSTSKPKGNDIYLEVWLGKVKYTYNNLGTCTVYVFSSFRIMFYNKNKEL